MIVEKKFCTTLGWGGNGKEIVRENMINIDNMEGEVVMVVVGYKKIISGNQGWC